MADELGTWPQYSVVIPAFDEEAVIGDCLDALLAGAKPGELEIVVVANGCEDRTAEVARQYGEPVEVLELEIASKHRALARGDAHATRFPRFYVDADVVFGLDDLQRVGKALTAGGCCFAVPRFRVDSSKCSPLVKAFYRIWTRLPYVEFGMVGTGVYALSEEGRKRFDTFPNIISDDGYARLLFPREERATIANASSTVTPPKTLAGVFHVKVRSHMGTYQIRALYPELWDRESRSWGAVSLGLLRSPRLWPSIPVYFFVSLVAKLVARWKVMRGGEVEWNRDITSRDRG